MVAGLLCTGGRGQQTGSPAQPLPGDEILGRYFQSKVEEISRQSLEGINTLEDWAAQREELRRQLLEMLGLWPLPERTELNPVVTGRLEQADFVVEKLFFQSRPGLYVTANLYRPTQVDQPLPAVLYLCGHGQVKKDGVSYGNKTYYQHHPAWFARHGYVSLVIDTLQLGEIEGIHHGTNRLGMWWWIARGYTPAGVETWNAMRALDYLQSRPEVDPNRIGVTGRSGGGAYSWFLSAVDERVKVAVPVAGITDLENHVVDGAIEGHCDCMFMVNTYGWDFPLLAALVAPRPLLLSNSDKDRIFPLDGVLRLHARLRHIYELYGAKDRLGLLITEGPHSDTQDLQVPAFRWMNRWLKEEDPLIKEPALKFFEPEELKVLAHLPEDQVNTRIHELFVAAGPEPPLPDSSSSWRTVREEWMGRLRSQSFAGWPENPGPLQTVKLREVNSDGLQAAFYQFESEAGLQLPLWMLRRSGAAVPAEVILVPLDEASWSEWVFTLYEHFGEQAHSVTGAERRQSEAGPGRFRELFSLLQNPEAALAVVAVRGMGPTAWTPQRETHIRRRFVLLGQTLDGMRVWDLRQAIAALHQLPEVRGAALKARARGVMAGILLYAALFEPGLSELQLESLPVTHREGPVFLNVRKIIDLPQAVAMALTHSRIVLMGTEAEAWSWPQALARTLQLHPSQLQVR